MIACDVSPVAMFSFINQGSLVTYTRNFIFSKKKISFPGHSPFESNAVHQEYEDTLVFSGSVGNISVGGDVLIDNNGRRVFKDEIMQTICKVCSQS